MFYFICRNIAMGTSSASGRIGSFIALYIIWLVSVGMPGQTRRELMRVEKTDDNFYYVFTLIKYIG
jgi:hypothetical protein